MVHIPQFIDVLSEQVVTRLPYEQCFKKTRLHGYVTFDDLRSATVSLSPARTTHKANQAFLAYGWFSGLYTYQLGSARNNLKGPCICISAVL